jgi:surface protein
MTNVFAYASLFNQPLNNWNTSNVTNMGSLFNQAKAFSQDISMWCVTNIPSKPGSFDN